MSLCAAVLATATVLVIAAATVLLVAGCAPAHTVRVLFVGNSYTSYNGGVDQQLQRLAPSIRTESITVGGATLKNHWTSGTALGRIRQGGLMFVVLQEQSVTPVSSPLTFYQAVRDFSGAIAANGASTVLLMTWQRPDEATAGVTTERLASAYEQAGRLTGATVAPAGLAFAASLAERPDLALNASDGHPTAYGTYLAACVLYGTLFGKTPVGNVAAEPSLPGDVQAYLQKVAARTLGY
jgi:hypothetical protein